LVIASAVIVALIVAGAVWTAVHSSRPPLLSVAQIPDQSIAEGLDWQLDVSRYVTAPENHALVYHLSGAKTDGMQIDDSTGVIRWIPDETQAPGSFPIGVEVTTSDQKTSARASFTVSVREVNLDPQMQPIDDVTFVLGSKDALELQILAQDQDRPDQQLQYRLGPNAPAEMRIDRVTGLVRWEPTSEQVGKTHTVEVIVADSHTPPGTDRQSFRVSVLEAEDRQPATANVEEAVYLLVVEEPESGTQFPFATAFAVGEDLLLTSGYVVAELAQAQEKGRAIRAFHCCSRHSEVVRGLLVSPKFVELAEVPERQIYNDFGLIQVPKKTRECIQFADSARLASIEQGTRLYCVTPTHEAEPLTRFDNTTPIYHQCKVYLITRLMPVDNGAAADDRRLLHLVGGLPKNAFGSPIVDEQGRAIALYSEKAELPKDEALSALQNRYHYAVDLGGLPSKLEGDPHAWWLGKNGSVKSEADSEK
jgi:hypothetical protein